MFAQEKGGSEGKAPRPPNACGYGEFVPITKALPNAQEDKTILRSVTHPQGFTLRAMYGEIGAAASKTHIKSSW